MGIRLNLQLFGGRGSSSGGGSGGAGSERFIADSDGTNIDLGSAKLKYGGDDKAVTGAQRAAVEAQEKKRVTAQVEYCQGFDANGTAVDKEHRGGKGSVRPSWAQVNAETFTHNHPRQAGVLGGSFSVGDARSGGDIYGFTHGEKMRTMRASAKEGTYSITKGKNFNALGTYNHCVGIQKTARASYNTRNSNLAASFKAGKITWDMYNKGVNQSFNQYLVEMHNGFAAGAKKYGYTYTLERRK